MTEHCLLTREQATLYQAVVDELLERGRRQPTGIERRGLVLAGLMKLKQVCNHPAHFLQGRLGARGQVRQARLASRSCSTRSSPPATGRSASPSSPSGATLLVPHLARRSDARLSGCTAVCRASVATRWSRRSPAPDGPADLPALAEGRRHRAQPHRRHARHPPRPLVESGRRGSGHRPRLPHRPAAHRARPQARRAGTVEERIDEMISRKRALAERVVGDGRGLDHATDDRRAAGRDRAARRRRERMTVRAAL